MVVDGRKVVKVYSLSWCLNYEDKKCQLVYSASRAWNSV